MNSDERRLDLAVRFVFWVAGQLKYIHALRAAFPSGKASSDLVGDLCRLHAFVARYALNCVVQDAFWLST